jgi:gamma-glutamyltranspeptidase/glutathione hydrolase
MNDRNGESGFSRRSFNAGLLSLASLAPAALAAAPSPATGPAAGAPARTSTARKEVPMYDWNWQRNSPLSTRGRNGMIASTRGGQPMADGVALLQQGGKAIDAALSMAIAQVVYAAGNWVSLAGLFTMAYYDASTGKVHSMNAGFNTVQNETDPMTIPMSSLVDPKAPELVTSGRAVLVPGFFAGIQAAHDKFSSMPFAKLFESGIGVAENGVYVTPQLAAYVSKNQAHFSRLPDTKAMWTKPDGTFYKEGDTFVQPVLAQTLRKIGQQGADYIYKGDWGRKFVKGVQADGGKMTMKDLADYRVEWADPLHMNYQGYDVYSHHQAHFMFGMLGLAQEGDLKAMGRYYESAEAFYWFHRIFRATGTNMSMMGERINQLSVPAEDWLNPDKVKKYWQQLKAGTFVIPPRTRMLSHSDAIVVIDRWGNVATLTHSTNTGNTGLVVDGITVPAPAANQQPHLKKVGPGKKLPNFIPNVIVLKDGKPAIATSAIGMGLHQETVKVLTNVIDYGKAGREAVAAPSLVEPNFDAGGAMDDETVVKGDYTPELLAAVRAKGLQIDEVPFMPAPDTAGCVAEGTRRPGLGQVPTIVVEGGEYEGVSARYSGSASGY